MKKNNIISSFDSATSENESAFYRELTTRNRHFISAKTQEKLAKIKVLVAGCGAAGGACTAPLARLGVMHFALADNGDYELNNLNRQEASVADIGKNKAIFNAEVIRGINPFARLTVHSDGISSENAKALVSWADFIIDAVDVTNTPSMKMKVELHRLAHEQGIPVVCPLDLGFCQWGQTFDYRDPKIAPLGGKYAEASRAEHPIKALMAFTPLRIIPPHVLPMLRELLTEKNVSASQLGCAADLLSAIISALIVRFVDTGELCVGWNINLEALSMTRSIRLKHRLNAPLLRREIRQLLSQLP